jgi:hypothetical protein
MLRPRKLNTDLKLDKITVKEDKRKIFQQSKRKARTLLSLIAIAGLVLTLSLRRSSGHNFIRNRAENNLISTRDNAYGAPIFDQDGKLYHVVFSTDCSAYQHWQSYLLFYSAWRVKQTGYITRIVSGCTDHEAEEEMTWHNAHISSIMSSRFRIHMTPHFSSVSKNGETVGNYVYFNKPYGLRHWLENDELIDLNKKDDQDTIVILIDPDMIFMRPITFDFSDDLETIVGKRASIDRKLKVTRGQPFAQTYGFGAHWLEKLDIEKIAGSDSPAKLLSKDFASVKYPVGPPYIAVLKDMYDIAVKWTEFVPRVHEQYPYLLAEMFAYCVAAAHLQLPHQIIDSLMVSNIDSTGEGWDFVDRIPEEEICFIPQNPSNQSAYPLPNVIHYCQDYSSGGIVFQKREMNRNFFTCESQLLDTPKVTNILDPKLSEKISLLDIKRERFMICSIVGVLNEAVTFFKGHHCS